MIVHNLHKKYTGLAMEFKSPNGKGILSYDQSKMLQQYQNNGFKTLVSNDYDYFIEQLIEYFRDVRIKCSYCARKLSALSQLKAILRVPKKLLKEMTPYIYICEMNFEEKRRREMDQLPRHGKHAFYCEKSDRSYSIG